MRDIRPVQLKPCKVFAQPIRIIRGFAELTRFRKEDTPRLRSASRLGQQLDAIAQLPKAEQKFVAKMLDNLLAQHGQESANAA
ncbi:MAG: hypothetical protein SXU28_12750 [Pseudomonadota bacterium]|nr:hypothetical protein [Pseudomonadota bacterium]